MFRIAMSLLSCLLVSGVAFAAEEATTWTSERGHPTETSATFASPPRQLEAKGPGTRFGSIDAAAIDALTHAYLQARAACDAEFMRGGTIYPVDGGYYSYGETHRAESGSLHKIRYILKPQDVARFHLYPVSRDTAVNRINERPSRVDLRSVSAIDPLHRPLFILHPSLSIRAYSGEDSDRVDVASLRGPEPPQVIAGKCSSQPPSPGGLGNPDRVAETRRTTPHY
jgi:hypothetical protein